MVHDSEAGKVETGSEPTQTSQDGIDLIKSFEGLELTSYIDAVGILTVGYGHTGSDVYSGQVITEQQAEDLLRTDLKRFEKDVVNIILPVLTQHEFDAIVSFTYNVGSGALENSTFAKRMNDGEDKE